jgi:hypothetical protein
MVQKKGQMIGVAFNETGNIPVGRGHPLESPYLQISAYTTRAITFFLRITGGVHGPTTL